jgi:uncharacterized protein (TIRG00374 family)
MKKNIFISVSLILGGVIFFAVLRKVGWGEVWRVTNILSWKQMLLVITIFLISVIFSGLCDKIILKTMTRKKIPFIKVTKANLVEFAISYLTPSAYLGGEPFKAILIKEEIGIDLKSSIVAVVIEKISRLTADILLVVVGAVYLFVYFQLPQWLNWFLLSILVLFLGLAFFFYYRTYRNKGFLTPLINIFGFEKDSRFGEIAGHIQEVEDSISIFFTRHSRRLISVVVLSLISRFFMLFSVWLIILFLGAKIGLIQIFGFYALTVSVFLVPIPGALGVQEMTQAVIFGIFGLKSSVGIAFSLIYRLICLFGVFIGLLVLLHFQFKIWRGKTMNFLGKLGKWLVGNGK